MNPSRQLFWNIGFPWIFYLLAVSAVGVFGFGVWRRYHVWRSGQPVARNDRKWIRLRLALKGILGHKRILRRKSAGAMHLLFFWGMIILGIGTTLVAIHDDLGVKVLQGKFYLLFKLSMDMAGLGTLGGVSIAIYRRYVLRDGESDARTGKGLVLALISGIIVTGFLTESLRIASTTDPWGAWSPVGNAIAGFFRSSDRGTLMATHRISWLSHAALALGFIGYIPYTRMMHMIAGPLNMYFRSLDPTGGLTALDLENDRIEQFGVGAMEDLNWKDLLDTDACVQCGRCEAHCPAHATSKPLSPMKFIGALRTNPVTNSNRLIGRAIDEEALWACTTCRACMEQCPAHVEHIPKLVGIRRNQVLMESRFPEELNRVFRNMENSGNPWGFRQDKRTQWWENSSECKVVAKDGSPEYLFFPGCAGSFDDRNRKVTSAVASLLRIAGVDFAILGAEEKCCGDSARRLGNEYVYQSLRRDNMELFDKYNIRKIITSCPHCFNVLKDEYPEYGGRFEVRHHAEFILELINSGRLKVKGHLGGAITYHDPCYLGRYNDIYQPPRDLINKLGIGLTEMRSSFENSFCCGAGGGRVWMREDTGERINGRRVEEVSRTNAGTVATACPFCLIMMEDGIKLKDKTEEIKTRDIAELVLEAVQT